MLEIDHRIQENYKQATIDKQEEIRKEDYKLKTNIHNRERYEINMETDAS